MTRSLTRVALAVLFSAILVVGAVLPAAAEGPVYRGPYVDPGGTFSCGSFPVQVTVDQTNVMQTIWQKHDGGWLMHFTGVVKYTFTNLSTGYSLSINLSGPYLVTVDPDGTAHLKFVGPQGGQLEGGGYFAWGAIKITEKDFTVISASFHGRSEEMCAALDH